MNFSGVRGVLAGFEDLEIEATEPCLRNPFVRELRSARPATEAPNAGTAEKQPAGPRAKCRRNSRKTDRKNTQNMQNSCFFRCLAGPSDWFRLFSRHSCPGPLGTLLFFTCFQGPAFGPPPSSQQSGFWNREEGFFIYVFLFVDSMFGLKLSTLCYVKSHMGTPHTHLAVILMTMMHRSSSEDL